MRPESWGAAKAAVAVGSFSTTADIAADDDTTDDDPTPDTAAGAAFARGGTACSSSSDSSAPWCGIVIGGIIIRPISPGIMSFIIPGIMCGSIIIGLAPRAFLLALKVDTATIANKTVRRRYTRQESETVRGQTTAANIYIYYIYMLHAFHKAINKIIRQNQATATQDNQWVKLWENKQIHQQDHEFHKIINAHKATSDCYTRLQHWVKHVFCISKTCFHLFFMCFWFFWDCLRFFELCGGFPSIVNLKVWDFLRFFEIFWDFLRSFEIFWAFWGAS